MGNGLVRSGEHPGDQGGQERGSRPPRPVPLGEQPGLEIRLILQGERLEEVTAECARELEQPLGGEGIRSSRQLPANLEEIDRDSGGIECDQLAIGHDALVAGLVDQAAKPAQGPAERAPGVVGNIPQQSAEPASAMAPFSDDQVREEGPGLARLGKRDRRPFQRDLELPRGRGWTAGPRAPRDGRRRRTPRLVHRRRILVPIIPDPGRCTSATSAKATSLSAAAGSKGSALGGECVEWSPDEQPRRGEGAWDELREAAPIGRRRLTQQQSSRVALGSPLTPGCGSRRGGSAPGPRGSCCRPPASPRRRR